MEVADLTELHKITNNDRSFANQMIQIFIDESSDNMANFNKFLSEENFQAISDLAHKLKPSLGYMAKPFMKETALRLELQECSRNELQNVLIEFISNYRKMIDELKDI